MARVTITVAGERGSGKTVIAKAIVKLLSDNGFDDVTLLRSDERGSNGESDFLMVETKPDLLKSLSELPGT